MTPSTLPTAVAAAMLAAAATAAAAQSPTPQIRLIEKAAPGNATTASIMRAPVPNTVDQVGIAMTCDNGVDVTVFLGAFPPAGTRVRLAVHTTAGRIERFGPVVDHAGPRSGFHSPRLTDPRQVARFLDAALENGALVSNGYNSFRNRVAPARNRAARATMRACGA